MHRTSTTATLLVLLASACAGCMSVEPAQAPDRPVTRAPDRPRPQSTGAPREQVRTPGRDALQYVGPEEEPAPAAEAPARRPATSAPRTARPGPGPLPSRPPARDRPAAPGVPSTEAELCALGKRTGALAKDSTAARICRERYGS